MNTAKHLSKVLLVITRILAAAYLFTAFYAAFCLLTGWSLIFKEDETYFSILYPFTQTPFLNGHNNLPYILLDFISPLGLYGLFFLLAGNVFKIFTREKLFTLHGIRQLKRFYMCNLIIPPVMFLLIFVFDEVDEGIILAVLHIFLGVFAYLLAAIFKQGVNLQNEQDLII
jgi:hypothetical protein